VLDIGGACKSLNEFILLIQKDLIELNGVLWMWMRRTPFPPVKPKKPLLINGFFIFSFATELSAHMGTHFYSWGALVLHSNLGFCHFGLYHATKSIFLPSFLADFLGSLPLVSSDSSTSFVGWLET